MMNVDAVWKSSNAIPEQYVTVHPGFADICLKRWVLRVAGIGFN
jgi:hypothetical protein